MSVIIDGEVPLDELASTVGLLAGAAGPASPIVVATVTPDTADAHRGRARGAGTTSTTRSSEHEAVLCEWFLVGGGTAIAVGEWSGVSAEVAGQRKSRERIPPPTGIDSSFSATTLITPSAFSSRPRISSAGAPRATRRYRAQHPFEQIDVDEPGLVLEVDERGARRRSPGAGGGSPRRRPAPGCRGRRPRASIAVTDARARRGDRARTGSGGLRAPHPSPTGRRSPPRAGLIPGNVGASAPVHHAARRSGRDLGDRTRRPQRRPPRHRRPAATSSKQPNAPAVASASSWASVAPARRVRSSMLGTGGRRRCALARSLADVTHRPDAEPHGRRPLGATRSARLERRPRAVARRVEVGRAHLDAVAAGVLHERVRRVEAHRLRVEQRRAERRRLVAA